MDNLSHSLDGKTAWITGSSRGLGRIMAEELSALGASVAVHGTRPDSPRTFDEGGTMEDLAAEIAEAAGTETLATWSQANQTCASIGAELACINSEEEHMFMRGIAAG